MLNDREFEFWEYKVSHGQLLIRSPKASPHNTNIDLIFGGVKYISLPRFLGRLSIYEGLPHDVRQVEELWAGEISTARIFVLISEKHRYYIIAYSLCVQENELGMFESSLISFGAQT
jgi:hypothetical protein